MINSPADSAVGLNCFSRLLLLVRALTWDPFVQMVKCVFKRREEGVRNLLFLMFLNYGCYLFLLGERKITYNYMLRVFEVNVGNINCDVQETRLMGSKYIQAFDGEDWALFSGVMKVELLVGLFVIVPIFSGRLGQVTNKVIFLFIHVIQPVLLFSKFRYHESGLLSIVTTLSVCSYVAQGVA